LNPISVQHCVPLVLAMTGIQTLAQSSPYSRYVMQLISWADAESLLVSSLD